VIAMSSVIDVLLQVFTCDCSVFSDRRLIAGVYV